MLDIEHLKNGVLYWHENDKMDDLMEFLVRYVRHIHSDRYYRMLLIENLGTTFLDIITPSDIAYVIAVIKNNADVWDQDVRMKNMGAKVMGNKEKKMQPLFTKGEGRKREKGESLWNKEGIIIYRMQSRRGKRSTIMRSR